MRTVTRVYDSYAQATRVVKDLEADGVLASEINLVANKHVSDRTAAVDEGSAAGASAGVGAALGGTAGLLAGLGILAIPGLGPVVAAGALAATAVGAAAGAVTGGVVGALVKAGVPEEEAHVYSEAVRRGATMVSVRTSDEKAPRAQAIMDRHRPIDTSVRAAEYRRDGWKGFDPAATPYEPSQAELDRMRLPYPFA